MKRFVSLILSLVIFLNICPRMLAAGIDKIDILSDGTVLTYVSTERVSEARKALVEKINKNSRRKISTGGNLAIKIATIIAGTLLCWAQSYVENTQLRGGLRSATVVISLVTFFYPDYVKYSETNSAYSLNKQGGLKSLLDCLDQCIADFEVYKNSGIVIVERPNNFNKKSNYRSEIYKQNPNNIDFLKIEIEDELRQLKQKKEGISYV